MDFSDLILPVTLWIWTLPIKKSGRNAYEQVAVLKLKTVKLLQTGFLL